MKLDRATLDSLKDGPLNRTKEELKFAGLIMSAKMGSALNRTKEELKCREFRPALAILPTLNRTKEELKFIWNTSLKNAHIHLIAPKRN